MTTLLVIGALSAVPPQAPERPVAVPSEIVCEAAVDGRQREYVLTRHPDRPPATQWTLALRDSSRPREIAIVLRSARPPTNGDAGLAFEYRSPHGGYIVDLRTGPAGWIDVFVSHGLEVNVEPDLAPEVDLLNTDGRRSARCRVRP